MDAYGVRHVLVVGPNSGYGTDNRCLLDALAHSNGRYKGIAFNLTLYGEAHYSACESLLRQAGFQSVLDLGRSGRAAVKLSGYQKFSAQPLPYEDARPFVMALMDAFTLDACLWASD